MLGRSNSNSLTRHFSSSFLFGIIPLNSLSLFSADWKRKSWSNKLDERDESSSWSTEERRLPAPLLHCHQPDGEPDLQTWPDLTWPDLTWPDQ